MKIKKVILLFSVTIFSALIFSFSEINPTIAQSGIKIEGIPQPDPQVFQNLSDVPAASESQKDQSGIEQSAPPILSVRIKDFDLEKDIFQAGEDIEMDLKLENTSNYYGEGIYAQVTLHKNSVSEDGVAFSVNQHNVYDLFRNTELVSLKPKEEKFLNLSYQIPFNLPNGEYNVNISIFNSREMNLDSFIKKINIENSKDNFVFADPKSTRIIAEDKAYKSQEGAILEYDKEYLPFGETEKLKNVVKATAGLDKNLPEGSILKSRIYRYGEPLSEIKEKNSEISFENNGNSINFYLPLFSRPGAYEAVVQFYQGKEKVSSPVRMRYIISGDSGLIYNFLVEKKSVRNFVLYLQNTSSADNPIGESQEKSETEKIAKEEIKESISSEQGGEEKEKNNAQIIFEARERKTGEVCFQSNFEVSSYGDFKRIPFTINEGCSDDLSFSAKLMKDGKQLDAAGILVPSESSARSKELSEKDAFLNKLMKVVAVFVILALILFIIWYFVKKKKKNPVLPFVFLILISSALFFSLNISGVSAEGYADYDVRYVGDPNDADGNPERLLYYNTVYTCARYIIAGCPSGYPYYCSMGYCANDYNLCSLGSGLEWFDYLKSYQCDPGNWEYYHGGYVYINEWTQVPCSAAYTSPIYQCVSVVPFYSWYPIDFRTPYGRDINPASPYLYFQNNIIQIPNCGNGEGVGGGWVNFSAYNSSGGLVRNLGTYGFGEYSGLNAYNLYLGGLPGGSYTMLIQGYIGMNGGHGGPVWYFRYHVYMPFSIQSNPTLSITKTGSGIISGTNIDCGLTCSATYALNTAVTLSASTSDPNSTFSGWGGDCAGFGTNPTCNLTMNTSKNVVANFSCSCSSGDSANYCEGTTYTNSCGASCTGTKPNEPWTPNSSTQCTGTSFTQTSNCGTTRTATGTMPSLNGQCGSAADKLWEIKPNSDLCSIGTASDPTSSENQWCWTCSGICGGSTTNCCAQRDSNWKEVAP